MLVDLNGRLLFRGIFCQVVVFPSDFLLTKQLHLIRSETTAPLFAKTILRHPIRWPNEKLVQSRKQPQRPATALT